MQQYLGIAKVTSQIYKHDIDQCPSALGLVRDVTTLETCLVEVKGLYFLFGWKTPCLKCCIPVLCATSVCLLLETLSKASIELMPSTHSNQTLMIQNKISLNSNEISTNLILHEILKHSYCCCNSPTKSHHNILIYCILNSTCFCLALLYIFQGMIFWEVTPYDTLYIYNGSTYVA